MFRRDHAPLTFATIGIPGLLGALLLLVWAIGWTFFGVHDAAFHTLVLVGAGLCIVQGVRRVNDDADDEA